MKVLIVEDNEKTANYLSKGLSQHYFTVETAYDGQEGLFLATTKEFDVIILDIMLPIIDGWALIKRIRESNNKSCILFLTARDHVNDRVKGLNLGADDYLIKPFAFSELLARIHSLLRRSQTVLDEVIQISDLKIQVEKYKAYRNGMKLNLTAKEFMLLLLFAQHQGEVLSRSFIAEQVWDINFDTETNAIDVAIKRLRNKVEIIPSSRLIHTVRGIGYVLEERAC